MNDVPASETTRTAVDGLLHRVAGDRAAQFRLDWRQPDEISGYHIDRSGDGVTLAAASGPAMTRAIGRVLERDLGGYLGFRDRRLYPAEQSAPERTSSWTESGSTSFELRYHYNYVTFAYTMAYWDWSDWAEEIDWLALRGLNAPLAVVGVEAAWYDALRALGVDEDAALRALAGPPYQGFQWMGCLHGWGGPVSRAWVEQRRDLGARIVQRQRELGMTPVLHGFAGPVPHELVSALGQEDQVMPMEWWGFDSWVLDPTSEVFDQVSTSYYEAQRNILGTSSLYAADAFIEMYPEQISEDALRAMAAKTGRGIAAQQDGARWLLQAWTFFFVSKFWTPERLRAWSEGMDSSMVVAMDLWADQRPVRPVPGFEDTQWMWCMTHHFGGRPGMYGRVSAVRQGLERAAGCPEHGGEQWVGVGMTMEALQNNPLMYDYFIDGNWNEGSSDFKAWLPEWLNRRYGTRPGEELVAAWSVLATSHYDATQRSGPQLSVISTRPTLAEQSVRFGTHSLSLDTGLVLTALGDLIAGAKTVDGNVALENDLVDVADQVLTNVARAAQSALAYFAANEARPEAAACLDLISRCVQDMEALAGTVESRMLGRWLDASSAMATNPEEEVRFLENAKRILTLWGGPGHVLHDYSNRHWAGLLAHFHLPRWQQFGDALLDAMDRRVHFSKRQVNADLIAWEEAWCTSGERYDTEPAGSALEEAKRIWETGTALFGDGGFNVRHEDLVAAHAGSLGYSASAGRRP